jgi:hypothetical protein
MHEVFEQLTELLTPELRPESLFVIPPEVPTGDGFGAGLGVGLLPGGRELGPFPDAKVEDNAPPS